MNSTDLNTSQYTKGYSVPSKDVGAVNIYINNPGVNQAPGYPTYYSPQYYYPPQYYYYPQTKPQEQRPLASQSMEKEPAPETKTGDKELTPLTEELLNGLSSMLTQGDEQARLHAIGKVLGLLREDPENRKKDPRLVGLINTALHPEQPDEVQTAAIIACNNGIVEGNQVTRQLLEAEAANKNEYGTDSLAASALSTMSNSGMSNSAVPLDGSKGQRLNVISH